MSAADKDGRVAQALSDRLACLSMEIHESIREGAQKFRAELDQAAERLADEPDKDCP